MPKEKRALVWDLRIVSPFQLYIVLGNERPLCNVRYSFESPWIKFQPPILVSSYINFLIQPKTHSTQRMKFEEVPKAVKNWVEIVDFVTPFMIELGHVLKGKVLYPSLYPASIINPSISYVVKDHSKILIMYKTRYSFLIELFDRTNILITSTPHYNR